MKRYALFAILLLFVVGTVGLYAIERHSTTRLTINPSEMKDGETKTFTDDGRKVTVRREGADTHVTIEGADGTKTLTITNDGSDIHIDGFDGSRRRIVVGPDRPRVLIDGMDFKDFNFKNFDALPGRPLKTPQTWFVCPKDHTMLRVPEEKAEQSFKCPLDGTTMEKRKGRGFAFFFDDDAFEWHDL